MMAAKIWRRVVNSFAPGTITAVDDTGPIMLVQVKIGSMEQQDHVPCPQQFGFASAPPAGSDAALQFLAGDRSNGVAVATNHGGSRFTGKALGESVVFNAFGMSIYLSTAGIVIQAGGLPVVVDGDLYVTGDIAHGHGTAASVNLGTHTHLTHANNTQSSGPTPGT